MTYEQYKKSYSALLVDFLSYDPSNVGSMVIASKLADLEESYPDYATMLDEEAR